MENFENGKLPQDKFGLHQTRTIYGGVAAVSIAYLVGFLKNRVRSYYGRTLSLIPAVYICAFQALRDGSARLCLNRSGCWLSFGNEFGFPGFTSSWECNGKNTMSAIVNLATKSSLPLKRFLILFPCLSSLLPSLTWKNDGSMLLILPVTITRIN